MKKSRFSEAKIVGFLEEIELGAKVGETCRKHGISELSQLETRTKNMGLSSVKSGTISATGSILLRRVPQNRF